MNIIAKDFVAKAPLTFCVWGSDLIYRRHRPVFWSPSSVSALAEAEVQYSDDHVSRSAYITFRITGTPNANKWSESFAKTQKENDDIHFLVWTTTPWTIPANMVSFRYQDLLGVSSLTLKGRALP